MPTYLLLPRFMRDHARLSAQEKAAFRRAVSLFIAGLPSGGRIHPSLRVHRISGTSDIWSMSWAPDGRATFEHGEQLTPGEPHIVWRRVGTHAIYRKP